MPFPSLKMGPGESSRSHTADEYVLAHGDRTWNRDLPKIHPLKWAGILDAAPRGRRTADEDTRPVRKTDLQTRRTAANHRPPAIRNRHEMRNEYTHAMATKLWDKGYEPDKMIEEYTVGDDRELDMRLARYDVEGSLAHIAMLEKIGLLTSGELEKLTPD